jgi:hypothetical protein
MGGAVEIHYRRTVNINGEVMTGNIKDILISSDAAKSLMMERRIAKIFHENGWPAERSVYYTDIETNKTREIDVISRHVLRKPEKYKDNRSPYMNITSYCECKSLNGTNIIFSEEDEVKSDKLNLSPESLYTYWIGRETEVEEMAVSIAEKLRPNDPNIVKSIYQYMMSRSYPDETALLSPTYIKPPPVDIIAAAFRETKGQKSTSENADNKISPVWSAARSTLSAVQAGMQRFKHVGTDYVNISRSEFNDLDKVIQDICYFFDSEILRSVYFHPFIVLNANLWNIKDDEICEIDSARLVMKNINFGSDYVDIVSEKSSDLYIANMIKHLEKESEKHIRTMNNHIKFINWRPGQDQETLYRYLTK